MQIKAVALPKTFSTFLGGGERSRLYEHIGTMDVLICIYSCIIKMQYHCILITYDLQCERISDLSA